MSEYRAEHVPGLPRFCGGAVGYAGYDVVRYCERLPNPPADDRRIPDMAFAFYRRMVIFDHINKTILVVANADPRDGGARQAYDEAARQVDELCRQLEHPSTELRLCDVSLPGEPTGSWESNVTRGNRIGRRKMQGLHPRRDIFQVVISQRLTRPTTAAHRRLPCAAGGQSQPVHVPAENAGSISSAARRRSWCVWKTAS